MASFKQYTASGGASEAFSIPTFSSDEIKVYVDGVLKTAATHYNITSYTANGGTVTWTGGNVPSSGTVRIVRDTDVSSARATYAAGSSIKAGDLNDNQTQALRSLEEDDHLIQGYDFEDGVITTAKLADDAITYSKIQNVSATDRILGRDSSGAGIVEEIAPAALRTMINVEDGATADQSNAEIRTAVEAASDSNVFTDADHSKLNAIEASATADQTNAEIRTAVEAATDSNVFTDADHTKLNAIEASADVTDATNVNAAGAVMNSDTTTADIQFVVDEDDFSSDLATKVPTQQSTKAYIGTYAQPKDADLTTLAGMQTGTASILAGGTALTATLAEINTVVDGKSVETTISDTDAAYPTSGAVVDYVTAQIAPIGGLEVIATDAAFPNTQPAAGVVISIADAGGLVVNGSGTSTTGRTVGASTVTINNIASNFNSTTVDAGVAMMVSSTGSGQIYNYHKATLKEADLLSLSNDINDFAARYRVVSGEPGSNNDEGDLIYDTAADKMKVYDSSTSAFKEVTSTGDFKYLFLCPAGGTGAPTLNGSIATYDLRETTNSGSAASITSAAQLLVSINGVVQKANTGTSAPAEGFALVDANTIIFGANLASGDSVFIVQFGSALTITTPGDNTVATAKLQNLSVTEGKIANDAVTADKLANSINTEIAANTAKVTNATHSGEVTGATALTIADNVVDEANLKVSNAPTNGYVLTAQSGNTGGMTWELAAAGATGGNSNANGVFWENQQTVTHDYTIQNNYNAGSFGPITINSGITVTVGAGESWTVI